MDITILNLKPLTCLDAVIRMKSTTVDPVINFLGEAK